MKRYKTVNVGGEEQRFEVFYDSRNPSLRITDARGCEFAITREPDGGKPYAASSRTSRSSLDERAATVDEAFGLIIEASNEAAKKRAAEDAKRHREIEAMRQFYEELPEGPAEAAIA